MGSRIELLQSMPIFGAIREETLRFLVNRSATAVVAVGEFFFREHDEANSIFVLEEGKAAVLKDWKGHQYLLNTMTKGDCFGEMSLMDMRHRSASVVAVEPCQALELTSADLTALYEKDLEQFTLIQMNMGREVSRRLREADEQLFQVKFGNAEVITEYVIRST